MKHLPILIALSAFIGACQKGPTAWDGPVMSSPRSQLTVDELLQGKPQPLMDMSFFARPDWAEDSAAAPFSGILSLAASPLVFPKEKAYYPGEDRFPRISLSFVASQGQLIPGRKDRMDTRQQSDSYWDVIPGAGRVWREKGDGAWSRASFPLTLTDRWVGQARNCVATFVYGRDSVSQVCLQCSQETADIDDRQLGNIRAVLPASFQPMPLPDSAAVVSRHLEEEEGRLPVRPLGEAPGSEALAAYFGQMGYTSAPTSLGAVMLDSTLFLHPPKTRHGLFPYPEEMRHGLYSVTKSMAGALSLFYFAERYGPGLLEEPVSRYVAALAGRGGWEGVTFRHLLDMTTGTAGGEGAAQLFAPLIAAETAEEAIHNIAALGDAPPLPGQQFNYASTNSFVLSYALQRYVESREGEGVHYWELVREHVLNPIGAPHFTVLHTLEEEASAAIPILAYGALPTLDEAAKIGLLLANGGQHAGEQLLHRETVLEALDPAAWEGFATGGDYRGGAYQHSFWSKEVAGQDCRFRVSYMLGFGENYVAFLPGKTLLFRFMDEHDLNIEELARRAEGMRSFCP